MSILKSIIDSLNAPLPYAKPEPLKFNAYGARMVPEDAVNLIKNFEALHKVKSDGRVYAYHDAIGLPTIGYGHLLSRAKFEDLSKYSSITKQEATELLCRDLDKFAIGVQRLVKVSLSEGQFGALVSFAFNVGLGNLQASTLLRKLNRGDSLDDVGDEFLKWTKAGGKVLRGLVRRREAERKMFLGL